MAIIDEKEFARIREGMDAFDAKRETIIKESRDILKLSKQAIYSIHRGDLKAAEQGLKDAASLKAKLEKAIAGDQGLRTGGFSNALEEYVEAKTFLSFVTKKRIATMKELAVQPDEYLLGLSDLTGELMRRAVMSATKRDVAEVQRIKECLDLLYGQFVTFDFRNGELRRKYDSIKYNLQKVENTLYDLSLSRRTEED